MERDPTVHLDADIPRCSAIAGCMMALSCARRMAPIPARGGKLEDFSDAARVIGECTRFIPIRRGIRPAPTVPPVVKDWPSGAD